MAMGKPKVKLAWMEDRKKRKAALEKRMQSLMKKAEELTILCGTSACLLFFNRKDKKLVVWPSTEEAESLIKRFEALPESERNISALDPESYMKNEIKKMEEKIECSRKVTTELEMDHLMFQLQNGRSLSDLSQTEIEKLKSYASKKITGLTREIGDEHPNTSVNEPVLGVEIPKATNVAPEYPMRRGSVYIMDEWIMDKGESSKSGGGGGDDA